MLTYVELHPENPQARLVNTVVDLADAAALLRCPRTPGYDRDPGGNKVGHGPFARFVNDGTRCCATRLRSSVVVIVDNHEFHTMKALTPDLTFILRGTKEVRASC